MASSGYMSSPYTMLGDPAEEQIHAQTRDLVKGSPRDWVWIAVFFVSQSLIGLSVYPAYLISFAMLIVAWKRRPYDAVVMLVIMGGGYYLNLGHSRICQTLMFVSGGAFLLMRNTRKTKRVMLLVLLYMVGTFAIALTSEESMSVQFFRLNMSWLLITFMLPLLVFANREFVMREFVRVLLLYVMGFAVCYFLDCYIFNGYVMFPYGSFMAWDKIVTPTLSNINMHPFSFRFPRIGPSGLVFMMVAVYPLAKMVKLPTWMWVVIAFAFVATRTATVTAGILISYVLFKLHGRQLFLGIAAICVALPLLYQLDLSTGRFLRIADTVDQFTSMDVSDDESFAEFGTGRMAQWIPKYEVLTADNREWLGFGFLDPNNVSSHKFTIDNDLYDGEWAIEEVVTCVEVTPLQTILNIGYIGLIFQAAIFIGIYFVIRKLKYSGWYLCMLIASEIAGLGGNGGWNGQTTLLLMGMVLGVILVINRQELKLEAAEESA